MVSRFKIEITSLAEGDLIKILDYYAVDCKNPVGAAKVARAIYARIYSLSIFPSRGNIKDINGQKIRFISTGKFNIYFVIDEPSLRVKILRISHARRNPRDAFTSF